MSDIVHYDINEIKIEFYTMINFLSYFFFLSVLQVLTHGAFRGPGTRTEIRNKLKCNLNKSFYWSDLLEAAKLLELEC